MHQKLFLLMTTPPGTNDTTFHDPPFTWDEVHPKIEHYRSLGHKVSIQDVTLNEQRWGNKRRKAKAYDHAMSVV